LGTKEEDMDEGSLTPQKILTRKTGSDKYVVELFSKVVSPKKPGHTVNKFSLSFRANNVRRLEKYSTHGCQIFLYTKYQNWGKYTKLPQHYRMAAKYIKWL
jgi:hypothetical protein